MVRKIEMLLGVQRMCSMLMAGKVYLASPRYIINTQQHTSVEACNSTSLLFSSFVPQE